VPAASTSQSHLDPRKGVEPFSTEDVRDERVRAERIARALGRFYPLLLAIVAGLLAVLRRRDAILRSR